MRALRQVALLQTFPEGGGDIMNADDEEDGSLEIFQYSPAVGPVVHGMVILDQCFCGKISAAFDQVVDIAPLAPEQSRQARL